MKTVIQYSTHTSSVFPDIIERENVLRNTHRGKANILLKGQKEETSHILHAMWGFSSELPQMFEGKRQQFYPLQRTQKRDQLHYGSHGRTQVFCGQISVPGLAASRADMSAFAVVCFCSAPRLGRDGQFDEIFSKLQNATKWPNREC